MHRRNFVLESMKFGGIATALSAIISSTGIFNYDELKKNALLREVSSPRPLLQPVFEPIRLLLSSDQGMNLLTNNGEIPVSQALHEVRKTVDYLKSDTGISNLSLYRPADMIIAKALVSYHFDAKKPGRPTWTISDLDKGNVLNQQKSLGL